MDTTSLIIIVCVIVPAILAIAICAIVSYSNCDTDRKIYRRRNLCFEYPQPHDRTSRDNYIVDYPRSYQYQRPQRRLPEPPPVFEEPSPSYDSSVRRTGQHEFSLFSPIYTTPCTTNFPPSSPSMTSSIYSTMPPSYAEIFLTPSTLPN